MQNHIDQKTNSHRLKQCKGLKLYKQEKHEIGIKNETATGFAI